MMVSFVIPTYNEHGNIDRLINELNQISKDLNITYEIIVIDDNSQDGTIQDIKKLQKIQQNLILIVRKKRLGVGSAHLDGFNYAKGDLLISMDADLSHSPLKIPEFIKKINDQNDLVIGSRFMQKGGTEQKLIRRVTTKMGNHFLSIFFAIPITDFTSGYRAIKKDLWNQIKGCKFSKKNSFLIETIIYSKELKAKISEIPIFIKEREIGKSKVRTIREAIKGFIISLKLKLLSLNS